jgi:hypothetical protein
MITETQQIAVQQITLAQKIFSIKDTHLLKKISNLITKENIVAYNNDEPLTEAEYIKQIDEAVMDMENGTDKGLTPEQVFKNISNAYHLE